MNSIKGVGVALVTPLDSNEEIDFDGLSKLLSHTANKGVDYYVVQGTTGESATMTSDEKFRILDFVKKNNPEKLPIVYGIGGNNTAQLLQQIESTNLEGVDALLSVSPYYNKPSQKGLIQHYTALADSSPIPIILYNVPGRTGSNIKAETTLELAKHNNIVAVKEAAGDMEQAMTIAYKKPEDFMIISGDDMLTLPLLSVGAEGVISVLANAVPQVFRDMLRYTAKGDYNFAAQEAFKLLEINPLMYSESNPVGIKQALAEMGICEGYVRLPLVKASDDLKNKISESLKKLA